RRWPGNAPSAPLEPEEQRCLNKRSRTPWRRNSYLIIGFQAAGLWSRVLAGFCRLEGAWVHLTVRAHVRPDMAIARSRGAILLRPNMISASRHTLGCRSPERP